MSAPTTPEGIYVAIDENQQGPYPEAEIDRMLSSGELQPDAPAWREGMGDWAALNRWYGPAQTLAPAPTERGERLGQRALQIGVGTGVAWVVLVTIVALAEGGKLGGEGTKTAAGLMMLANMGANAVGAVYGGLAVFGQGPRSVRGVIGLTINAFFVLLIVFVIVAAPAGKG